MDFVFPKLCTPFGEHDYPSGGGHTFISLCEEEELLTSEDEMRNAPLRVGGTPKIE